ncbi:MAG: hypothetical protein E7632_10945, partial [Ruminococcaceae bacterium]|nr:hypothetical protein [Oscillospiraceae bacterium]
DKEKGRIFIQTHANPDREYSDNTRAGRWDFPSPYPIRFRVVRFQLNTGVYETLTTSLPREKFTADDLRELYHARWGIETAFLAKFVEPVRPDRSDERKIQPKSFRGFVYRVPA